MKLFKDALYNYIRLNDAECEVVDSKPFQRLRYIKQLAMAYLVYPGANHTRFEHSLGVLFLAKKYFELHDLQQDDALVFAALLHDIGHGPFSHESEPLLSRYGISHEDLSYRKVTEGVIAEILEKYGVSPRKVGQYIRGNGKGVLITGAIGIDRIDYLMRDSYYAGTMHGKIDHERLLNTTEIKNGKLLLSAKGIEEAESLVISRFMMFTTLYQHKTVSIARGMLQKAIEYAYADGAFTLEDFADMTDYECLMRMNGSGSAARLVQGILNRRLYKAAVFMRGYEIPENLKKMLSDEHSMKRFEEEICEECKLSDYEVIASYTSGSYKPIDVQITGEKMRELAEVSDVVASVKEATEKKRFFFVAVPEDKRVQVSRKIKKIIEAYY